MSHGKYSPFFIWYQVLILNKTKFIQTLCNTNVPLILELMESRFLSTFSTVFFEFSHHQRKWLVSLMMQEVNCKKAKKNGKFLLTFFSKKNHTKNHLFVQENFLLPYLFEKESVKNFDNIFLNNSTNDCPSTIWSCFLV